MLKLLNEINKIDNDYQYRLDRDVTVKSKANGSIVFRWYEKDCFVNCVDSEGLMIFETIKGVSGYWCCPDKLITAHLIEGMWITTLYASRRDYNNAIERWKQFNGVRDIRQFLAA